MRTRKFDIIYFTFMIFLTCSCHDLDLYPTTSCPTEDWYNTVEEIEMSCNEMYLLKYWAKDGEDNTDWTDDTINRNLLTSTENGTINGMSSMVYAMWSRLYAMVAQTNTIIEKADSLSQISSSAKLSQLEGEAYFFRAVAYGQLAIRFGDLPYYRKNTDEATALKLGRTGKSTVMKYVYEDFDSAVAKLPEQNEELTRVTKYVALAFESRIALYNGDWSKAAETAKRVIDAKVFTLDHDYANLFYQKTITDSEFIFVIQRSVALNKDYQDEDVTRNYLIRNADGWASINPSWELMASYTCTDGQTIDTSPLFDAHNPFNHRDPRLSMTIVPFGEDFLGFIYDPSPSAIYTTQTETGEKFINKDSRVNDQYASYNGLVWKKGIDKSWTENGMKVGGPRIIMRFAEVLLNYAEAKIEMKDIDQSVIDAMNTVRARAYGVDKSETTKYPAFTILSQKEMRKQLRIERRMELAGENMRYADIIRWKTAEVVMNRKNYGIIYPSSECLAKVVDTGNWFWPYAPQIDNNGCPNFSQMESSGYAQVLSERKWDNREYLWPIPTVEIQTNPNIEQNPGY